METILPSQGLSNSKNKKQTKNQSSEEVIKSSRRGYIAKQKVVQFTHSIRSSQTPQTVRWPYGTLVGNTRLFTLHGERNWESVVQQCWLHSRDEICQHLPVFPSSLVFPRSLPGFLPTNLFFYLMCAQPPAAVPACLLTRLAFFNCIIFINWSTVCFSH